jgi:hypothetical protein
MPGQTDFVVEADPWSHQKLRLLHAGHSAEPTLVACTDTRRSRTADACASLLQRVGNVVNGERGVGVEHGHLGSDHGGQMGRG